MSFAKSATLATVVVGGGIAAMVLWGRGGEEDSAATGSGSEPASAEDAAPSPDTAPQAKTPQVPVAKGPPAHPVRELVPPTAWLVADFKGDLAGQKPFSDQQGMCANVPAPERVAMAVLPPSKDKEPDLLIAAREVEDVFWGCARDRIVRAGGTALAQNDRYEVLKSPSGVVARGPQGSMVFLTSETQLEAALAVLSDLSAGSGTSGAHANLYRRLYGETGDPKDSVLDVTLALPDNWLDAVGQDKEKTPLRFIHSAFVGAHQNGSAQGGIDCDEAGCAEVLEFLDRAKNDLLQGAPAAMAGAIKTSLKMEHVKGAGRITINWAPSDLPLAALLGPFLGPGITP